MPRDRKRRHLSTGKGITPQIQVSNCNRQLTAHPKARLIVANTRQERFPIGTADTGLSVSGKCVRNGVPLILKLATVAADDPGAIPREDQDLGRRAYFSAGPPADGRIDWAQPADSILRFVRASDYARLMSQIERELREQGDDKVLLVPALED